MPRVENCGDNVNAYCDESGEGSSTYDVCNGCARDLKRDPHHHDADLVPYNGDPVGDEGWVNEDCDHPPYEDEDYRCEVCGCRLGRADN